MPQRLITIDGNEAVARVAYQLSEVIAIYPITPASPMGEWADEWAAAEATNAWGVVPTIVEMQSEGGAAGALHGALQAGALATTFTASQGLLLMLPNLFKLAGELSPGVIHVAARTVAAHALSIFGDHSDVMACRSAGAAMLASSSVQEAMDLALVAHAATLRSRIPFLHFFDGFRTSHEIAKIVEVSPADMRALIDDELVHAHRQRALSPEHPVIRGTAQNPDAFFQSREAANRFYLACPAIVQESMDRLAATVGRQYHLFDYVGAPDATRIIVMMGSGAEAAEEAVRLLNRRGEAVGLLKVRLFRPFAAEAFVHALPASVQSIAVLDRTKESGALGEPLYLDVVAVVDEAMATRLGHLDSRPIVVGGRYGLSSKEFTPAMAKAIFENLGEARPRRHFTIGITDDVTRTSLDYDPDFDCEDREVVRAVFYGLGSDGTVGANKNAIKIIGETTPLFAQGYFVYDSKKAGAMTVSHLRFGPRPIHSTYVIRAAEFVACHQFALLDRVDVLSVAAVGAVFLLNSPYGVDDVWDHLPAVVRETLIRKAIRLYVIDADRLAGEAGLGRRINTIMQTCFFALSGVVPREQAIAAVKDAIRKSYGKRGGAVVEQNCHAVDLALEHLHECNVLDRDVVLGKPSRAETVVPEFVRDVTLPLMHGRGDFLPVSVFPADGTFPSGTSKWEKRNLASTIPEWDDELCIQCGKCVMVCPHAALRAKVYEPELLAAAPATFKSAVPQWKPLKRLRYTLQVAPEDCTGCTLCVEVCPAQSKTVADRKALNMTPQAPVRSRERQNWQFFLELPDHRDPLLSGGLVKRTQLLQPLFEFSGACAGCGETPYLRLLTQLFGDRAIIANATGCSSIYGGNLPTTPYTVNCQGRGPAWANSLFEDNAEFGLGIRLAIDAQRRHAEALVKALEPAVDGGLADELLHADQTAEAGVAAQRSRVAELMTRLAAVDTAEARDLRALAGSLVRKSVWIVGGDGWAYDIGFGGLDHVLASGENVKILVLDTEVYSNTGGQRSKATPRGAVARFAAGGKTTAKKDLALMAMSYGNVYVARVALGANDTQTVRAFEEAEAFDGPALILAYGACVAHGYDLAHSLDQQKLAVHTGYWPLLRYNPARMEDGQNPFALDSQAPAVPLSDYLCNEGRFTRLTAGDRADLLRDAEADVTKRWQLYSELAAAAGSESVPQSSASSPSSSATS
jgi:pyruvate-ferredoxin/flavodoxin oxidoreductase